MQPYTTHTGQSVSAGEIEAATYDHAEGALKVKVLGCSTIHTLPSTTQKPNDGDYLVINNMGAKAIVPNLRIAYDFTLKPESSKIQALPTAEPEVSEALVEMLEDALKCAKSGEFTGLAYAATDRHGNTYSAFILNQPVTIIGELRVLERDIIDECVKLRADNT